MSIMKKQNMIKLGWVQYWDVKCTHESNGFKFHFSGCIMRRCLITNRMGYFPPSSFCLL